MADDADILHAEFRSEAIELGRLRAETEADTRGETGEIRDERIRRAEAYAAWEFDGKPDESGDRYRLEFGLPPRSVTTSERDPAQAMFKKEKK